MPPRSEHTDSYLVCGDLVIEAASGVDAEAGASIILGMR